MVGLNGEHGCVRKLPTTVTAWRCGDILYSVCPQLKPNDELIYKFYPTAQQRSVKLETLMISETDADAAMSQPP